MSESLNQNQAVPDAAPSNNAVDAPKFNQDETNYLMSKIRAEAYQQGLKEAQKMQQEAPRQAEVSQEDIARQVQTQMKELQDNYVVGQIKNQYIRNYQAAKEAYPDFEEVFSTVNLNAAPTLIPLLNSMPNAVDVMYELGKDDDRSVKIISALMAGQEAKAEKMMHALSQSLANNKVAKETHKKAPEPLNKLKASAVPSADDGLPTSQAAMAAMVNARYKSKGRRK